MAEYSAVSGQKLTSALIRTTAERIRANSANPSPPAIVLERWMMAYPEEVQDYFASWRKVARAQDVERWRALGVDVEDPQ